MILKFQKNNKPVKEIENKWWKIHEMELNWGSHIKDVQIFRGKGLKKSRKSLTN